MAALNSPDRIVNDRMKDSFREQGGKSHTDLFCFKDQNYEPSG